MPSKKEVIHTFRAPTEAIRYAKADVPYCMNGQAHVIKYKVTVEVVEEPVGIIRARIIALWRNSNNSHEWTPLRKLAAKYGFELDLKDLGADVKNK